MLTYLPPTYPDELLYSLIARTHLHLGSTSSKRTIEMFFGSRNVRASVALPTHLGALSCRLPPERALSPESLLRDFTLYPYLTAFQPREVRDEVAAALIRGNSDWINVRLGLAATCLHQQVHQHMLERVEGLAMLARHGFQPKAFGINGEKRGNRLEYVAECQSQVFLVDSVPPLGEAECS